MPNGRLEIVVDAEDVDGFIARLPGLVAAVPPAAGGGTMLPGPRRG
jgi:hypothetical protein